MNMITVDWLTEHHFTGTSAEGHRVTIGGGVGSSPVELLLMSLASCAAYDVVDIVEKQRGLLHGLTVRVEGARRDEIPRKFVKIHLIFTLTVTNLTQAQAERAVSLSLEKYCSVYASLDLAIEMSTAVELVSPDVAEAL